MKNKILISLLGLLSLLSTLNPQLSTCFAQGTAFTYQGQLTDGGQPAQGIYDLRFAIYDALADGNAVGGPLTNAAVVVSNGLFTVALDFGNSAFAGEARWMEIGVRTNGGAAFTTLTPRQPLTPAPYALYASDAGVAAASSNLLGVLPDAQLSTNVARLNSNNVFRGSVQATSFVGDGAGITGVHVLAAADGSPNQALAVDNTGQVGVGTTNPITQFHVPGRVPTSAIGAVATSNGPCAVAVSGRCAYVIAGSSLQVFDVSAPAAPTAIGKTSAGSSPIGVAIANQRAYVVGWSDMKLHVFDVSNPTAPTLTGSVLVGTNNLTSVAVAGRYAYVAGYNFHPTTNYPGLLQIVDVSDPACPVLLGSAATYSGADSVTVAGSYVYLVSHWEDKLEVFDVNNPSAPTRLAAVATASLPNSVAVAGRHAYVANLAGSLQVFDVSDPTAPTAVGAVGAGDSPWRVVAAGRYAYLVEYNGPRLRVFDVSAPAAPTQVGSVGTGSFPEGLAVAGRYAYVVNTGSSTLQVFDLGGAYIQALEAGTLETATLQTRGDVTVGNHLDVGGGLVVNGSARISGGLSVDQGNLTVLGTAEAANFRGSGAGLTNLQWSNLVGLLPDALLSTNVPRLGATQTFSGTNTFGDVRVSGLLRSGSEAGTHDPPSPAGLVIRRINSFTQTAGQVVARTATLTLERDGSDGGFRISHTTYPGYASFICCLGMDRNGNSVNFYKVLYNPSYSGTVQIYSNAQQIVHFKCSFGNSDISYRHATEVTLSRYADGSYNSPNWIGTVVSTYNQ